MGAGTQAPAFPGTLHVTCCMAYRVCRALHRRARLHADANGCVSYLDSASRGLHVACCTLHRGTRFCQAATPSFVYCRMHVACAGCYPLYVIRFMLHAVLGTHLHQTARPCGCEEPKRPAPRRLKRRGRIQTKPDSRRETETCFARQGACIVVVVIVVVGRTALPPCRNASVFVAASRRHAQLL